MWVFVACFPKKKLLIFQFQSCVKMLVTCFLFFKISGRKVSWFWSHLLQMLHNRMFERIFFFWGFTILITYIVCVGCMFEMFFPQVFNFGCIYVKLRVKAHYDNPLLRTFGFNIIVPKLWWILFCISILIFGPYNDYFYKTNVM